MNYENITTCDVCNGEGFGIVLWVSGCDIKCPGCHNKETWNPESGKLFDKHAKELLYKELSRPEITRLTISGGHPLMPCNRKDVLELVRDICVDFEDIEIWLYTGYTVENLTDDCRKILSYCNVVVDGPFIESQKDLFLPFRGSRNQRIFDVVFRTDYSEMELVERKY